MVAAPTRLARSLLRRGFDGALVAQQRLRRKRLEYLFVLGHARSGSSLLMHLLNESPEICALGETWIEYDRESRLRDLMLHVHGAFRKPLLTERYVADKIIHDGLLKQTPLLGRPDVRTIFLVREPARALLGMFANRAMLKFCPDWHSAIDYYSRRLERLAAEAESIGDRRRSFFCTHAALVGDSRRCLDALGTFLELGAPLPERYRVGRYTGVPGLGDFSLNIHTGRIVEAPPPAGLEVPEDILARGREVHTRCVARLAAACGPSARLEIRMPRDPSSP